jgi:hypothetical protein
MTLIKLHKCPPQIEVLFFLFFFVLIFVSCVPSDSTMQLIVFSDAADPIAIFVPDDADTDILYQIVAAETGKSLNDYYIEFEDRPITTSQLLIELGIFDGSTVFLKRRPNQSSSHSRTQGVASNPTLSTTTPATSTPSIQPRSIYEIPADIKPEDLLRICQQTPNILQQILSNDSELGQMIQKNDISQLRGFMMKRFMNRHKQEHEKRQDLIHMEEDPMNPDIQKKIEEQVSERE